MRKYKLYTLLLFFILGLSNSPAAQEGPVTAGTIGLSSEAASKQYILAIDEFIRRAAENDTEFEQILIDELTLKYEEDLQLPAADLVLSVKQQHEFYFSQDRESEDTTVELTKLFPLTGTELSADYSVGASVTSATESSSASFIVAQPIAENAFGRSTRLLKKIVGLEVDIASHQIVEAYEDYLATIISAYYAWYEDFENLKIAQSSYKENLKLLDNMHERQRQKVALPIDVNKVKLQVMAKKENLIAFEEQYANSLNVVKRIIRYQGGEALVPEEPEAMWTLEARFEDAFETFRRESRTFDVLRMLEQRSSLVVSREADDLLPSINLITGYELSGEEYGIKRDENLFFAGIELEWPIGDQVDRAEYEVSKILNNKTELSTANTYYRLYTQLANLYLQIEREHKLISVTKEKIELARSILEDESENYSFGKVTLNDYIQAVNVLDNTRFELIRRDTLYKQLLIEWLRLTDRVINKQEIRQRHH